MTKHRKPKGSRKPPTPPAGRPGVPRAIFIVLTFAGVTALGCWLWKSKSSEILPAAPLPAETSATNPPPAAAAAKPDRTEFQKLNGRWQRPDGGYVIDVRSIDNTGKVDAAYYNPKPIHVAKAEASLAGTVTRLFIELRDVNYPGSTYTLAYNPAADQLTGIYYQALQQESFEVIFVRMK